MNIGLEELNNNLNKWGDPSTEIENEFYSEILSYWDYMINRTKTLELDIDSCKGIVVFNFDGSVKYVDGECHCGRDLNDEDGSCSLCGFNPESCQECRKCGQCFCADELNDFICSNCSD